MARVSNARRTALQLLGDVRRRDARARELLRTSSHVAMLDDRDRALVTRLVLGVVATRGFLDAIVESHLSGRAHLQPKVRDALRLGTYELLFLSTPQAAAVSQGVELVRLASPRAVGLANAVLHKVADIDVPARLASLAKARECEASVDDLAMVSGYPAWFLSTVLENRGGGATRDLALSALEPAPLYVAVNEAKRSDRAARELLQNAGLDPHPTDVGGSYVLGRPAGLSATGMVEAVDIVVADLSAQRVAQMAAPTEDARMLEVGQGRGTKSILLQGVARRGGTELCVRGVDSEEFKVRVAQDRMRRAGLAQKVSCTCFDACDLVGDVPRELAGPFDAVLVDAPCSGTGTLRRHPEIAWSLLPADVDSLSELQFRMLRAASTRIRAGGTLIYATCSVLKQENEGVVRRFLESDEGGFFSAVDEPFQSLPAAGQPDGHFCAVMSRR